MSCEACDEAQGKPASAFYRWKNANVEIRGCDRHLKEIFDALNAAQAVSRLAEKAIQQGLIKP